MSFVAEILNSAEKIEVENLNKQIPNILSKINGFKQDVLQYMDKIYVKFSERPKSNTALIDQAANLNNNVSEIERVVYTISNREVSDVKSKVTLYKEQLTESKHALQIASMLIHLHEILIQTKVYFENKQYYQGIKQIDEIKQYQNLDIIESDIFNGLIGTYAIFQDKFLQQLMDEFKDCIQYSKNKPYTLIIKENSNIAEILMAIGLFKIELIDELVSFLWKNILSSIINHKISVDISESDTCKLSLNVLCENEKDYYKVVFDNLLTVFDFLSKHFNYLIKDNTTILNYIGDQIGNNLCDHIIKNCLTDTIPSSSEELQKYNNVIEDTEYIQAQLIKNSILPEGSDTLSKYIKSIDTLFINKKCEEYTATAIEIMRKDLHDMVETEKSLDISSINSPIDSTSKFPCCLISRSTLDLIDLTDRIMQNAESFDESAEKFYSTVQNIYQMYGSVVQEYHQKLLQTIPQQVALFHNNCMFLSHKLYLWSEIYQKQTSNASSVHPLFMIEAHLLKQIGNKAFLDSLQQQIKQIEDIMKESGLTSGNTLEKLEPVTEKSIRQCLRQQELLRTVWHRVLSQSDYNKSIGGILSFLCNFIINELLKYEDISAEAGDQLVDIFKVILTRGPKLFIDPKDIYLYVKNWYRFQELVFVLSSSLIEISDRWADGKGPLALQYKPEELQKFIRALFQNTDRRAAVLARIGRST